MKTNFYSILPNISFDYYQIKPNNYSLSSFRSFSNDFIIENLNKTTNSNGQLKSGFLKLNSKNLVCPITDSDSLTELNCIGIWMTNIPKFDDESVIKNNPYVWAACTKFVLSKHYFRKTFSPSSDKNTFLLCIFDEKNIEDSLEFHEFKVVTNQVKTKTKTHNSWVIIESEKALECDENFRVDDLVKKPTITKKPADSSDRCNVYTLAKFLGKYEFGVEAGGQDGGGLGSVQRVGSHRRKNSGTASEAGRQHGFDLLRHKSSAVLQPRDGHNADSDLLRNIAKIAQDSVSRAENQAASFKGKRTPLESEAEHESLYATEHNPLKSPLGYECISQVFSSPECKTSEEVNLITRSGSANLKTTLKT